MLLKLRWGTYFKSTYEERQDFIHEAERMIKTYGWESRTVMPYSYPEKVTKLIGQFKDFDRCTNGTKEYLIDLMNGLADIMNGWEKSEHEPKVKVRCKNGKVVLISEDVATLLVDDGIAEFA